MSLTPFPTPSDTMPPPPPPAPQNRAPCPRPPPPPAARAPSPRPPSPPPAPPHPTHTMGAISALPENLLREVLSRVGSIKSLFMLAVTCRGWLRRFTDPAFLLEMLCPGQLQLQLSEEGEHHHLRLLGIFRQDTVFDHMDRTMVQARMAQRASSAFAPTFLPAPWSPLGPVGPLTSLVGDGDDDGTFNYAEPLAARRGIVLMRLAPRTAVEMDWHLFGVCNPVTGGDCHVLPPLKWSVARYGPTCSYAIVTAADDSDVDGAPPSGRGFTTFSQLLVTTLLVSATGRDHYCLHSYSAATRSWSTPTRCLDADRFSFVGERSAVLHQGAAHWLCLGDRGHVPLWYPATRCENRLYKLSVEVATGELSLTKIPVRGGGKPLLCVTKDGKLALASVYPAHVTVWTQLAGAGAGAGDGGGAPAAAWPRISSFRIPPAVPYPDVPPQRQPKEWCNFGRRSILVLYRNGRAFILDLHKEVMEKVMDCFLPPSWVGGDDERNLKRVAYIA